MQFFPTPLRDAVRVTLDPIRDERGWFARSFCAQAFGEAGLPSGFPQHNLSFNEKAGTVRGLHFQAPPHEEPKLIRCIRGAIFDVIVDLRPDSETFGSWFGATLTAENGDALFAPAGFAHGFQTLEDDVVVSYLMGAPFVPGSGRGIRYDDPDIGIVWPRTVSVISGKDLDLPPFAALSIRA